MPIPVPVFLLEREIDTGALLGTKGVSGLGHGALIRRAGLDVLEPFLDVVPARLAAHFLGMKAELQDELYAEAHHGVSGGDVVGDEVTRIGVLNLIFEPVQVGSDIGGQSFEDRVRKVGSSATGIERHEAVHEESTLGGVHVFEGFCKLGSLGRQEIVKVVVGCDEIPGMGEKLVLAKDWSKVVRREYKAGLGRRMETYCVMAPLSCTTRSPSTRTGALPMLPPLSVLKLAGAAMEGSRS